METTFDHLVLPVGHRDVILSLMAERYRDDLPWRTNDEHVDIVRGKGAQCRSFHRL